MKSQVVESTTAIGNSMTPLQEVITGGLFANDNVNRDSNNTVIYNNTITVTNDTVHSDSNNSLTS